MYPKKQAKSDAQRFCEAFEKKVGAQPAVYCRRKLASGMEEAELRRMYDMLAVEIARRAHCTAIRYDGLELAERRQRREAAVRRAAEEKIPKCPKCGANMVLRTAQKGPRRGMRFWGCSNYPMCRCTREQET